MKYLYNTNAWLITDISKKLRTANAQSLHCLLMNIIYVLGITKSAVGTQRQNDAVSTSMRRYYVALTSLCCHIDAMCLLGRFFELTRSKKCMICIRSTERHGYMFRKIGAKKGNRSNHMNSRFFLKARGSNYQSTDPVPCTVGVDRYGTRQIGC